ncbi:nitronate monooxygenase [Virgisporangium aliadipatigenens]|uniref:Propionate 3-nitronate monooxygenase n=1 Tax=Virgisporangium aliadipatigenens TaxID=741659 RepID=A0A8J3YH08_9ACTN|nr:nitronate monooxygenase [Virgisporangium aliadipatigenens]GIJ43880.1 nitronate monooxygenase [Virgisporangium aliadipatigenens]
MTWRENGLTRRLGLGVPIVQAPMAGGWTTPRLVAEVCEAGGLGSVAGAMLPPADLRAFVREVRSLTSRAFAVNLFAPLPAPSGERLEPWARLSDLAEVPAPRAAVPFEDQLAVVLDERVPVFSFTFGLPPLSALSSVDTADGVFVIGTATTVAEAVALEEAGVHAIVAQGYEAGGHRGTFLAPVERSLVGTVALVPQVVDAVSVPVIASGGIMDGRGIAAARALGAQAVQLGSAFLRTEEAGTGPEYRAALGRDTTVTNVLTGRHARAVRTPLVERLEASGVRPPDYPLPRLFLKEPPLLVGQAGAMARALPARELMAALAAETDRAIGGISGVA